MWQYILFSIRTTNVLLKTTTTYFWCLVRLIKSLNSAPSLVLRKDISKRVKTCEGAKNLRREKGSSQEIILDERTFCFSLFCLSSKFIFFKSITSSASVYSRTLYIYKVCKLAAKLDTYTWKVEIRVFP